MFFTVSKILNFLLSPWVWIVIMLIYGILTAYPNRKKIVLKWSLILALFFSNPFILDECMRMWEVPAIDKSELKTYKVGIVLGGMSVYDSKLDRAQFFRASDRLIQAVELYKKGVIKKILFSGGSGRLLHPEMKEGNYINRYLLYMGVPAEDFIIESESRNTYENAVFTKMLIEPDDTFLLITSAIHMKRSLACFEKQHIKVIAYSTDRYAGPRKYELEHLFIPDASTLYNWTNLMHEFWGYITYKIVGYI
ncbi:MAG: YdcF family protein [Bacteroidia bacterium]